MITDTGFKQITKALVKAQKAFGPALKQSNNPHFRSRYADLASCIEAVIDGLNDSGIALIQKTHPSDSNEVVVETIFLHESGEMLSAGLFRVPAIKNDPQGFGSALTYARRYGLMAACGIAPEDDDGNAASGAVLQSKAAVQRPQQKPQQQTAQAGLGQQDQTGSNLAGKNKEAYLLKQLTDKGVTFEELCETAGINIKTVEGITTEQFLALNKALTQP